ncbi:MAG: hypothetical protein NTY96_07095, partial [Bacteroidetes bacterium]|nr:hypothetical protein [Bacteroidota bacterium]
MKLHPRRSKYLTFILFIASLTALAFVVYTITGPVHNDFPGNTPGFTGFGDTLVKGKPPVTDTAFHNLLQRADVFFSTNKLSECLAELEMAQKLKPTDKSVNTRIVQIKGILAANKKKQPDFDNSIVSGDAAFQKKDYLNAKAYYQLALNIFPTDSVAKAKLRKTMDLIRSQKAQNTLYDVAVANADRLLQAGEYDRANEEYDNAARILPSEQYPKQKINEIIKIKVDLQLQDGLYAEAIKNADQYYNAKNWQPSLLEYQNASKIRPQEKYPKDRIAELTTLIAAQRSKDEAYIKLIASADQFFTVKSYASSRKDYESASKIKPEQPYPKNKIAEIDGLLAKGAKTQKDYEQYISLADSFYIDKNFIRARDYYTLALDVRPGESYPKEMLEKVKPNIAGQAAGEKAREESYLSAIAVADKEFINKAYDQAKKEYQRASGIKPAEVYPIERIADIDKLVTDQQQAVDKPYLAAITSADKLLAGKSYTEAKAQYAAALALKPGEAYPGIKIAEIDKQLEEIAKKKALNGEFLILMTSGEKLYKAKSWEQAKAEYQKALILKPDELLPKRRITSIDSISEVLLRQKSVEEQYTGIITNADMLFASKTYNQARSEYQKAVALKPLEGYPKTRIQEIDKQLAELARLKQLDEDYRAAVKKGDSLLGLHQYAQAKAPYTEASALIPAETYPKEKLTVINIALADLAKQQALDKQYLAAITTADKLLASKYFSEAKTQYNEALAIKPGEVYPGTKIAEIDKVLEEIARQKAIDSEFSSLIASAEKLFGSKSFDLAKSEYQKALALKPAEFLPKKRITSIDSIAEVILRQKSLDDQYTSIIGNADNLLASRIYEQAKSGYQKAVELKPSEAYPKTKIQEIDKQLAEMARLKKLDDDYQTAIKAGDSLFKVRQYTPAKVAYTDASELKPAENYPKEKLSQVNKALEDLEKQQALDKIYATVVATADRLFEAKSYTEAKAQYTAASALKPGEAYPGTKIADINILLEAIAKQKALDEQYAGILTSGEKLFIAKSWVEAKTDYQKALTLKPGESIPKQRISSIDSIGEVIQKQKTLDAQYNGLIANADKLLSGKTYESAKSEYGKASALKPAEVYPRTKIAEIEKSLADLAARKARDSAYTATITNANMLLTAKSYEEAKAEYQKALQFKADDLYTKTKISEIDKAVSDITRQKAMVESNFKASVTRADQLLASKSYDQAKVEYAKALSIKSGEQYPQDKIKEIDNILAELKAKDDAYKASLAQADQMLFEKKYEDARTEYENSLTIKPAEQYPKNKIDEINRKLTDIQGRKKTFDDLVIKGDNAFGGRDYSKAREYLQQATALFPEDKYARDRLGRVNTVIDSLYLANKGK